MQLELQQRLPELLWILLLSGLATPDLLRNEALHIKKNVRRRCWILSPGLHQARSDLNFSLDKAGDILLVLKHRQRVEHVVDQPVPVLVHLLYDGS